MIIDTEAHVFQRVWPVESDPSRSLVERYGWHEHSGDLLIAEMDRAGVDRAFIVGYDGYDFSYFMERHGGGPDDFWGGRSDAYRYCQKYPDRLLWVPTLRDPRFQDAIEAVETEKAKGAIGIKIFPSYLELAVNDPVLEAVYRRCRDLGLLVVFGFEDTEPPRTPSLDEYFTQLDEVVGDLVDLRVQLNHGGNVELGTQAAEKLFDVVRRNPSIYVSTSVLGGTLMEWRDGWEYPFPAYLESLERYAEEVPATQLMWGTDWPWYEHYGSYPQMVDAVRRHAAFFRPADRDAILGGNAERLLSELHDAALRGRVKERR